MKIYLFNPETGVYLGEDFADEAPTRRGDCIIPADATAIVPPHVEQGEVLLFNSGAQRWEIHSVTAPQSNRLHGIVDRNESSEESL